MNARIVPKAGLYCLGVSGVKGDMYRRVVNLSIKAVNHYEYSQDKYAEAIDKIAETAEQEVWYA